ncbi:hypothetical protein HF086_017014 [Spodoptera exigua]|uniref:Tetratricopeptide repeat protein 17 n=1 Tax=Spodoptera exigua TaxID=7107 RepID=A0A922SGD5_SPOEX|nr:hypothetical protein HF086_017014 [Spodoptera exigua]
MWDSPYLTCLFLYIFSFQIIVTNSRTSNIWKLNAEGDQIVDGSTLSQDESDKSRMNEEDPIFNIVTSTVYYGNTWTKHGFDMFCTDCQIYEQQRAGVENSDETTPAEVNGDADDEYLDCGKAVNFTYYDNLVGVARRHRHPNVPEPQVLLNLARVLFTLQYLDDAIYLTRRSLEVQPPDRSAWQQYFTLGEIFKAYGHYQEAAMHLRHALDLKPDYEPAMAALKDIENTPEASVHVYTLLIIVCLVMGVLLVILSSVDSGGDVEEHKTQRHFNRAMAMRSLRGVALPGSRGRKKGGS